MRIRSIAIAATFLTCMVFIPSMMWAQSNQGMDRDLFDSANRERIAQGLPALKWNVALAGAAHKHAAVMAEQGNLSHQLPGELSLANRAAQAGIHFVWLAENIAQGPNAQNIHAQWVKSPNHRANLLDHDMDSVGIGVAEHDGQWFAVEDFAKVRQ